MGNYLFWTLPTCYKMCECDKCATTIYVIVGSKRKIERAFKDKEEAYAYVYNKRDGKPLPEGQRGHTSRRAA
jgi:hypothetical protein